MSARRTDLVMTYVVIIRVCLSNNDSTLHRECVALDPWSTGFGPGIFLSPKLAEIGVSRVSNLVCFARVLSLAGESISVGIP